MRVPDWKRFQPYQGAKYGRRGQWQMLSISTKCEKPRQNNVEKLQAAENRLVHGLSTKARTAEKERQLREVKKIDAHLLKSEDVNKNS